MENHPAKHFVLQLGSLLSLYLSLTFLLLLIFGFVNVVFPDSVASVWEIERSAQNIRLGFAMVLVFFPTYVVLTRLVNKYRRTQTGSSYLGLTKWLIYISLLLGGLILLSDLVAVIMSFLEGELTSRFLVKAATVLIVIGSAFMYYTLDVKNYWMENEKRSLLYGLIAGVLIFSTLGIALTQIANPAQVREMKIDNRMVEDLQNIQWRIEDYYRTNGNLPENLSALISAFEVPSAPENRPDYEYEIRGEESYALCATFTHSSVGLDYNRKSDRVSLAPRGYPGNYNWDYRSGYWCFERVITPEVTQ